MIAVRDAAAEDGFVGREGVVELGELAYFVFEAGVGGTEGGLLRVEGWEGGEVLGEFL